MTRRSLSALALVFLAGAVVAIGGFFVFGHNRANAAGPGYGMMGRGYGRAMMSGSYGSGYGPGMMGGSDGGMMGGSYGSSHGPGMMGGVGGVVQSSVTPAELAAVRDRVEKQLASSGYKGFTVGEIMAFSNNDYALVKNASGKPAFELLADPKRQWLMPEPQSAMWNTAYGMMRGISVPGCPYANGSTGSATSGAPLTAAQAKTRADAWLAQHYPGQATADATAMPGYFTIDVAKNGTKVGMLSVNQTTGAVWYHTWHGEFLADQDF